MDKYFKNLLYITCLAFTCSTPLAQEAVSGQTCAGLVSDASGTSLRAKLFDENGNPKEEFLGMEGYAAFAGQYYESRMDTVFRNTSTALSKGEIDELGWKNFEGTVTDYRAMRNAILDDNGNLRKEFLGMEGYIAFVEMYHKSGMRRTFLKISAILSKREMDELGWQVFYGSVNEYRATRNRIMDGSENLRSEFLGMDGYAAFAKEYHESRMHPAFVNISVVLSKREMDELGWQQFQGTVAEYHVTRSRILDENGNLRAEFLGMEGYASFAEQYYKSRMQSAFINTSAVLSKREMDEIGLARVSRNSCRISCYKKQNQWMRMEIFESKFLGMDGYAAVCRSCIMNPECDPAFQKYFCSFK